MAFKALGLKDMITRTLADEGYETPTQIQAKAIPPILEGRDVLGTAQTGTGKTAAFALPVIHRLTEIPLDTARRGPMAPRVLVLSPTRELAAQIGDSFRTYGRNSHLKGTVIFGGVSQHHQVRALRAGIDILVATPGRLVDLMDQGHVDLSKIGIFILDEADRMLDMGFIQPIRYIASKLPKPRQTLLFSATMPREIVHLAESLLVDPVRVSVAPVAGNALKIEERLYAVPFRDKQALLEHLLEAEKAERVVVFTKTKHGADKVCKNLLRAGVESVAIHGNKAQNFRTRALDGFRSGRTRVLVATDVAARGLDVDGITHVFNYDLPMEPEAYVHRIGRTGRAGATGVAIAFCDGSERDLLRQIERLTGKRIPKVDELPDVPRRDPQPGETGGNKPHGAPQGDRPARTPAEHKPRRDDRPHSEPRRDTIVRGGHHAHADEGGGYPSKPRFAPRAEEGQAAHGASHPFGGGGYGGGGASRGPSRGPKKGGFAPGGGAKRTFGPRKGKGGPRGAR